MAKRRTGRKRAPTQTAAARRKRAEGRRIARATQETPAQTRRRAATVRRKKASGKTLTREEAGLLGAQASVAATKRRRARARRAGRGREFEREHRVESWTRSRRARRPHVTPPTAQEVRRIRAKKARGETLTRHESGVLGGTARVREEE